MASSTATMKVTALVPWFGTNRTLAHHVGVEVGPRGWVGVPFAGSMTELRFLRARTLLVGDLHRHLMNLARVVAHPRQGPRLYRRLRRAIFHPDQLADAQRLCRVREAAGESGIFASPDADTGTIPDIEWAEAYFIASWMGRSGTAGTKGEFNAGLATRWTASGGDSAVRYQNAVASLPGWRRLLKGSTFVCMDAFDFLDHAKDSDDAAIYADPPFPGPGGAYRHTFGEAGQRRLARLLGGFQKTRVVCRFYDHPLVRELYPEGRWTWRRLAGGKTQTNEAAPEVLLMNGASYDE